MPSQPSQWKALETSQRKEGCESNDQVAAGALGGLSPKKGVFIPDHILRIYNNTRYTNLYLVPVNFFAWGAQIQACALGGR